MNADNGISEVRARLKAAQERLEKIKKKSDEDKDVKPEAPRSLDALIETLSSGNKRRKGRYSAYMDLVEEKKKPQKISSLLEINKRLADAKQEVIKSVAQDIEEDINSLVNEINEALKSGKTEDQITSLATKLQQRITELGTEELYRSNVKINQKTVGEFYSQNVLGRKIGNENIRDFADRVVKEHGNAYLLETALQDVERTTREEESLASRI